MTFAAVVATGMGDRTMSRGDADLKIGRALWVVFSWFVGGFLALVAAGTVAWVLLRTGTAGLILALGGNLALRILVKQRADRHEQRYHPKTPQEIALEAKG